MPSRAAARRSSRDVMELNSEPRFTVGREGEGGTVGDDPMLLEPRPLDAPAAPAVRDPWGFLVLGSLVLAALTLLLPSTPTYDPWAWIIWGREIIEGDLVTTTGPSWKPLPMLFTVPFALFGDAAPDLWMWIARATALMGIVAVADLAARMGGRLAVALAALLAAGCANVYVGSPLDDPRAPATTASTAAAYAAARASL